jgi:hypothetical protein
MKRVRFLGHGARVIQAGACGDNTRKVWKGNAKIAVGVLMDKTDIVPDASYLSF